MSKKRSKSRILESDAIDMPRENDGSFGYLSQYEPALRKAELVAITNYLWDLTRPYDSMRVDPSSATVPELRLSIFNMLFPDRDPAEETFDTALTAYQLRQVRRAISNPEYWNDNGDYVGSTNYNHSAEASRPETVEIRVQGEVIYQDELEEGDNVEVEYAAV